MAACIYQIAFIKVSGSSPHALFRILPRAFEVFNVGGTCTEIGEIFVELVPDFVLVSWGGGGARGGAQNQVVVIIPQDNPMIYAALYVPPPQVENPFYIRVAQVKILYFSGCSLPLLLQVWFLP